MIHLTSQNLSPKEIVQNAYSPLVAVVCSTHADEICQKNNLSFVEMLQPFCKLTSDAYLRDPMGSSVSVKGIRLNVCDIGWRPPQTILARKMLNEAVTSVQCDRTKSIRINDHLSLDIPLTEPWFEQWKETFLTVQFPSDHEFTRHFLCCLIVLSSSDPNPFESANMLTKKVQMMQNVTPPKLPKWFSPDVLNCYILIHDGCNGDITKAQQAYESLKMTYGDNKCFLLQINSFQGKPGPDCPDPWLRYLKRLQTKDLQSEQDSAPKTPQDSNSSGVSSMPMSVQMSTLETPPSGLISSEVVMHPLSPIQDSVSLDMMNPVLSSSTDSLVNSQLMNPNVWASEPETADLPHGMWLTPSDMENLRHFVQDFSLRALIPYVERLIAQLNESIANKKGVSRSLLSATKRWFVTNKPGVNTSQNAVVYTSESTELQTRKMGDLYFMFGHYSLAFQAYHQAKRDFNADSAWQYYAGALEMAALSAYMQSTANRKTLDYMEEAIVTYLNICKLPQFATRATLMSIECLKQSKLFGEAAKQLIRMTSEDSDLRSALLLEQASYCFLYSQPSLFRKYAFHSVLAGHRYSKAGQRRHAFRCYKQAFQVFQMRGWSLAEDHIQYTIGKQAITLKRLDEAGVALSHLLRPSSLQSASQQAIFLKEYIVTQKSLEAVDQLLTISLPRIVQNMTRVLVTSQPPVAHPHFTPATNITLQSTTEDDWKWQKLEHMAVNYSLKKPVMVFKPVRSLFTNESPCATSPLCVHGEPIEIGFTLENCIKPTISFDDINLLWTFEIASGGEEFTNGNLFYGEIKENDRSKIENVVASTSVESIKLEENQRTAITIKITPKSEGLLKIVGIVGRLSALNDPVSLCGMIKFDVIPIRSRDQIPNPLKVENEKRLEIEVLPPAPALYVSFSEVPSDLFAGEIVPITLNLVNSGTRPLVAIYLATETPRWLLTDNENTELPLSVLKEFRDMTNENLSKDKEARKQHVVQILETSDSHALAPNETKCTTMWLQAPYVKGKHTIRILFFYELPANYPKLKYRLVRHEWNIKVHESLRIQTDCSITNIKSKEIGIEYFVKNMNQVHHPLAVEIIPHQIHLYCSQYKLNAESVIHMTSSGQASLKKGKGLKMNESINLRLAAEMDSKAERKSNNPQDFIRQRLSSVALKQMPDVLTQIPPFDCVGSFLMKHETRFINMFQQSGSGIGSGGNEEFSSIISKKDKHLTTFVTWRANVYDNGTLQRVAYGVHFTQMKNLYEEYNCPLQERLLQNSFDSHSNDVGIFDSEWEFAKTDIEQLEEEWGENNVCVTQRCFVEDTAKDSADISMGTAY